MFNGLYPARRTIKNYEVVGIWRNLTLMTFI
jgi:hypothetical protein